jgi:hypothetical protein
MNNTVLPVLLWRCDYSREEKNEIARKIASVFEDKLEPNLNAFFQKWKHYSRGNVRMGQANRERRQDLRESAFDPLRDDFLKWSATLKHDGFEEEHEWRLACYVHEQITDLEFVQFRDGPHGRTPYIKVPLGLTDPDSPLKRIVAGPSQNQEQAVISLKMELAKRGIRGVEVTPSGIPYRNW